jgi:RimJ/RimL family protein N-acetyltransferase
VSIEFSHVDFREVEAAVRAHAAALPGLLDSFVEDQILASRHYRVRVDGRDAGVAAIRGGTQVTQFALADPWQASGQRAFRRLRALEGVRSALVPTADEFFLAHALDEHRAVATQAYLFAAGAAPPDVRAAGGAERTYALRQADAGDLAAVRRHAGDFFGDAGAHAAAGELFVVEAGAECVGFGLLLRSRLYADVGSVGMYTVAGARGRGVGTAAVGLLVQECEQRGWRAVAGCAHTNAASKRVLERAGFVARSRLLDVAF